MKTFLQQLTLIVIILAAGFAGGMYWSNVKAPEIENATESNAEDIIETREPEESTASESTPSTTNTFDVNLNDLVFEYPSDWQVSVQSESDGSIYLHPGVITQRIEGASAALQIMPQPIKKIDSITQGVPSEVLKQLIEDRKAAMVDIDETSFTSLGGIEVYSISGMTWPYGSQFERDATEPLQFFAFEYEKPNGAVEQVIAQSFEYTLPEDYSGENITNLLKTLLVSLRTQ